MMAVMALTVGAIGLGNMGLGMAANLLRAGFPTIGYDIRPEAVAALVERGGRGAASPRAVGAAADAVLVMVLNAAQMQDAIFGREGLVEGLRAGTTVIGSATIGPTAARQIAAALAERDISYIDAPVSGGKAGAERGALTIMVGADPEVVAAHRPLLAALGAHVYHAGPVGAGQAAKLCNQVMAGAALAATAECLTLAAASGLDRQLVFEIITQGAGDCWFFRDRGARIIAGDEQVTSRLDIWTKDLGLVLEAADEHHLPLLVTSAARQWAQLGVAEGLAAADDSAIIKAMERLAGVRAAAD